ncbi:MAG TPA: hypothetical protein VFK05_26045 [Polyangiaceae bacterium]|nr:hypothetical protein [Polyangiaceae bacterium]
MIRTVGIGIAVGLGLMGCSSDDSHSNGSATGGSSATAGASATAGSGATAGNATDGSAASAKAGAGQGGAGASAGDEAGAPGGGKGGTGGQPGAGGKAGSAGESTAEGGKPPLSGGGFGGVSGTPGPGQWVSVTGTLAGLASDCGNVSYISDKPDEDRLLVAVAKQGIFSSLDSAQTWTKLGTGQGSDVIQTRPSFISYDPDHKDTWYVSGIYGTPGINKTTDNGLTFKALGSIGHNDGMSVDYTDPDRKVILAGGHEMSRTVYRTEDGGQNWTNVGVNLPADSAVSSYPYAVNGEEHLVGCSGGSGKAGIYRTTNGGGTWTWVSQLGGGAEPLLHSDGSLYWSTRDAGGLVRSTDKGQTWITVTAPNIVFGITPVELPDGRLAMRGPKGVLVSGDQGYSWTNVAPPDPTQDTFRNFALTYSKRAKAFFVVGWTCDPTSVPVNGIVKFAWDYEQQ